MRVLFFIGFVMGAAGCSTSEPVIINAGDISYGTSGETVKDTLDKLGKATGGITHDHDGVYAKIGHAHSQYALTSHKHKTSDVSDLDTTLSKLDTRVTALESGTPLPTGSVACPAGYTQDKTITKYTLCRKQVYTYGSQPVYDEMIKVGDFWIDKYEACVGPAVKDCKSTTDISALTGKGFTEKEGWTTKWYAYSVAFQYKKATGMSYYQAQMACANVGKHLCTNAEWQTAAAGSDPTKANFGTATWENGGTNTVLSAFGVHNMLGNAAEWVGGLVLDSTGATKALLRGGGIILYTTATINTIKREDPAKGFKNGARCCISGGGR